MVHFVNIVPKKRGTIKSSGKLIRRTMWPMSLRDGSCFPFKILSALFRFQPMASANLTHEPYFESTTPFKVSTSSNVSPPFVVHFVN